MATSEYRTLTARDLNGMDKEAKAVVLEAMDAGCVGKVSTNNNYIIRDSQGATFAVPRHPSHVNRAWQNLMASATKIITAEREYQKKNAPARHDPPVHRQISPTTALRDYAQPFGAWMDTIEAGVPADALIEVTGTESAPVFTRIDTPEPAPQAPSEPEQRRCPHCGIPRNSHMSLIGHLNRHTTVDIVDQEGQRTRTTITELSKINQIKALDMHEWIARIITESPEIESEPDVLTISRELAESDDLILPEPSPEPDPALVEEIDALRSENQKLMAQLIEITAERDGLTITLAQLSERITPISDERDAALARLDRIQQVLND